NRLRRAGGLRRPGRPARGRSAAPRPPGAGEVCAPRSPARRRGGRAARPAHLPPPPRGARPRPARHGDAGPVCAPAGSASRRAARRRAVGDERMVRVYVRAATLLAKIAALESARTARALAYRLAWATQSVRYDVEPLARALGWCPRIDLARGLAPRVVRGAAG